MLEFGSFQLIAAMKFRLHSYSARRATGERRASCCHLSSVFEKCSSCCRRPVVRASWCYWPVSTGRVPDCLDRTTI